MVGPSARVGVACRLPGVNRSLIPLNLKLLRPLALRTTLLVSVIKSHLNSTTMSWKEHVRLPNSILGVSMFSWWISGMMIDKSLSRLKERQIPDALIQAATKVRFSAERALISATPSLTLALPFVIAPLAASCRPGTSRFWLERARRSLGASRSPRPISEWDEDRDDGLGGRRRERLDLSSSELRDGTSKVLWLSGESGDFRVSLSVSASSGEVE